MRRWATRSSGVPRRPDDDRAGESCHPTGAFTATPHRALDCALGRYLNDPNSLQTNPQQNQTRGELG